MTVELLTNEQIAAMLPDQLREYGATLANAYGLATAQVSEALRVKLEADTQLQIIKNEQKGLKDRMSLVQSLLRSLKEGF